MYSKDIYIYTYIYIYEYLKLRKEMRHVGHNMHFHPASSLKLLLIEMLPRNCRIFLLTMASYILACTY